VAGHHALDLGRVYVLSAGDDHVLEPVMQVEEAVGIEGTAVAGAQPAAGEPGGGRLGVEGGVKQEKPETGKTSGRRQAERF
jgi:hypothetical protein